MRAALLISILSIFQMARKHSHSKRNLYVEAAHNGFFWNSTQTASGSLEPLIALAFFFAKELNITSVKETASEKSTTVFNWVFLQREMKQEEKSNGGGGGVLWFGSLGPADIAEPTILIRTFNIANLRTAYFLDRKGRSKFILLKVYALLHKKHYKLPHVAEALRGNVVKTMNLSSLYQLFRHIVIEETDASRAARLWRGNFHRRIFTLNTW